MKNGPIGPASWSLGRIVVDGEVEHQSEESVRAYLAPQLRGSFLTLDLQEVKRLFETLPWVRQAVVQREFPNRLHVTLQEHEAVAWWGEVGGGKLVNRQGAVDQLAAASPHQRTASCSCSICRQFRARRGPRTSA